MSTEREKALIRELLSMAEEKLRMSQEAAESADVLKEAAKSSKTALGRALLDTEVAKQQRIAREQFEGGQAISNRVQEILGEGDE